MGVLGEGERLYLRAPPGLKDGVTLFDMMWMVTYVLPGRAMARKKISTTVYITPEQNERLKLLHERTKVPVAEYIRQGIDLVLDKYRGALPGQLTLEDLGPKK
jgi:ribbon-helix-helix protein